MPTKREALAAQGLAKAGARGKFSTAANAWLAEQRAKGVVFSDDSKPVKPAPREKVETDKPTGVGYPDYIYPSDYRFPEEEYQAVARINGKRVVFSMRECCNTCRVSLTNHGCDSPTIHDTLTISIERR